jgi:Tol biopolymer transport system component
MTQPTKQVRKAICYILLLWLAVELVQCSPPPPAPSRRGQRWGIAETHDNVTLLSAIGGSSEYPAWSPDGTQIAFQHTDHRLGTTDDVSPRDIYVMNSNGTEERCLTCEVDKEIHCEHPSWAPNSQLVVASCEVGDGYNLYVINIATNTLLKLTDYIGDERYPVWSPDGTQIVFLSQMDIETNHEREWGYNVYTIASEGANLSQLAEGAKYGRATWSPDGQQVSAALMESNVSTAQLCRIDLHSLALNCNNSAKCGNTAWSPNGSQIACVSGSKILAISVENGGVETLLDAGHYSISGISWSPDGTRLVFAAGVMTMAANDLYVLEVEP